MKVQLTYFKESGKYYSDGSYDTGKEGLDDIWDEVRTMWHNRELPGLVEGHGYFIVSIDVPEHKINHPHLFI